MDMLKILLLSILLPILPAQSTTTEPPHVVASTRSSNTSSSRCIPQERDALLAFTASFFDFSSGRLFSWQDEECCRWVEVQCDDRTNHVIMLNFSNIWYADEMDSSIGTLSHLRYLDLSFIVFSRQRIPSFLGALRNLRYLDLSNTNFMGPVPSQLGNLSRLQHLNLSCGCCGNCALYASDLSWLPRLSSLKNLDMSYVNLSSVKDWTYKVNTLPNLRTLVLTGCSLSNTVPTLSHSNLTHLEVIDLAGNPFNSALQHSWFWDLSTIKELHLSYCGWSGPIPDALGNMCSLEAIYLNNNYLSGIPAEAKMENLCNLKVVDLNSNNINVDINRILPECSWSKLRYLDLHGASLTGKLPVWMGNLSNLGYLDISENRLIGVVPVGIGKLSNLSYLGLGLNNFSGVLSEEHFSSLVNLKYLNLSQNSLKLNFGDDWIPPFRLKEGYFGSCDMGSRFPVWLSWQAGIVTLDISNTGISDSIPDWFWAKFSNSSSLDLSRNQLNGDLPNMLELHSVAHLDLSRNSLSGQLPSNLTAPDLRSLLLHDNHFTGTIPGYVCSEYFNEINLSNNNLTGDFSQCSVTSSSELFMLDLKHNSFSGEFPRFLGNCSWLSFVDLSYNKFSGNVPVWVAEENPYLEVLVLRSNLFHGYIPKQLTNISTLHYLDVAHNNLSGSIPSSLGRLRAMTHSQGIYSFNYSSDSLSAFVKDRELKYTHELVQDVVLIDLSSNAFTGYIPKELFLLKGLRSLNLSSNQLSGAIPGGIGMLTGLESLDLSYNYFTGEIPSSLSDLTFLSCLNLSYNDLSGRIPSGKQLQTINDQYMYIGNPGLCGPPLHHNCSTNETNQIANQVHGGEIHDVSSFYLSLSAGFMVGLWIVFCAMLFKKTWRVAYFRLFDTLYDKIYVQVAIRRPACRQNS